MTDEQMYVVRASTHMNYTPGGPLVDMLPPGDNYHLTSKPMKYAEAHKEVAVWKGICQDRWTVTAIPARTALGEK